MQDFDVGARLRQMRQAAGQSQRQLAEASGVPHGQISMIETNRSSPRWPRCARFWAGWASPCRNSLNPMPPVPRLCSSNRMSCAI
ncbi:helix-turn-helix domain-containing protein [Gemmobacter lanyuensis]